MHTSRVTPASRVVIHPAAATSLIAVLAIENRTGRIAYRARRDQAISLITAAEARLIADQQVAS